MENLSSVKAFILCGGQGTRLASVLEDRPKLLAPVGGKSFLDYLIVFLNKAGLNDLVFLTGHKSEHIQEYLGDSFHYSKESTPLGTGGALKQALQLFPANLSIVFNGDTLFMIDLSLFFEKAKKLFDERAELQIVVALKKLPSAGRYGIVRLDHDATVLSFEEKMVGAALINAGVYLVRNQLKDAIGPGFVSLEKEVFTELVKQKKMAGIELSGDFLDIGTLDDYERAQTLIPLWMARV